MRVLPGRRRGKIVHLAAIYLAAVMTLTDKHSIRAGHLRRGARRRDRTAAGRPAAQIENPYLDGMASKAICLTAGLVFSTQAIARVLRERW